MAQQDLVNNAFAKVEREYFLPEEYKNAARLNQPLPIGYGQTNSQPSTVQMMLKWLDVQAGQKILDIGSGSGWTSALLGYLTGPTGSVDAVEIVPELLTLGEENCRELPIQNITFHMASEDVGWPQSAPYDRILVSASARALPDGLLDQLAAPGRLVIPIGHSVYVYTKDAEGNVRSREHQGFVFVPLVY